MNKKSTELPDYPIPADLKQALKASTGLALSKTSQDYKKIVEKLKKITSVVMLEKHYLNLFKRGLYLEEYQNQVEISKYELRCKIEQTRKPVRENDIIGLYKVSTNSIDEENPSIKPNLADITDDNDTAVHFTMKISEVCQNFIQVEDNKSGSFSKIYSPNKLYHVRFRDFDNYTFRCCHYAIEILQRDNTIHFLFPSNPKSYLKLPAVVSPNPVRSLEFLNASIESNKEQKQAVANIVNKSSYPTPYILYGPPGTGKTATLVEAICQIVKLNGSNFVLVCTPSIRNIFERL